MLVCSLFPSFYDTSFPLIFLLIVFSSCRLPDRYAHQDTKKTFYFIFYFYFSYFYCVRGPFFSFAFFTNQLQSACTIATNINLVCQYHFLTYSVHMHHFCVYIMQSYHAHSRKTHVMTLFILVNRVEQEHK